MPTPSLSAPTREFVTENQANASALQTTMELLVSAPFAPTDAVMPVFASLKNSWQWRPTVFTTLLGMPKSKLDVCAILADVDPIVLCVSVFDVHCLFVSYGCQQLSAPLVRMCSRDTEMRRDATAPAEVSVTTRAVSAVASTATTAPSASSRPSSVKRFRHSQRLAFSLLSNS